MNLYNNVVSSAPPVDSNFVTSCRMQRERSRHIECDSDDLFSAVQCMGPMCFCVDRNTGERINAEKFSMRERNSVNCSAGQSVQVDSL